MSLMAMTQQLFMVVVKVVKGWSICRGVWGNWKPSGVVGNHGRGFWGKLKMRIGERK